MFRRRPRWAVPPSREFIVELSLRKGKSTMRPERGHVLLANNAMPSPKKKSTCLAWYLRMEKKRDFRSDTEGKVCPGGKWHAEDLEDTWGAGRLQKWKATEAVPEETAEQPMPREG